MADANFDVFSAAREHPDRLALVSDDGSSTYAELARLAARALGWLRARLDSLQKSRMEQHPVAVLAAPNVEQIAMAYALFAAGIPLVPVHPKLSQAERAELLGSLDLDWLVEPGWLEQPASVVIDRPGSDADREAIQALVLTSGTSGTSKLARLSQRAFAAAACASAARLGWQAGDRWLLGLPFAHIGGLSILTRCLAARSTVVLAKRERFTSGPAAMIRALQTHRVSLVSLVPTQLVQLLEFAGWQPSPKLRAVLVGGAACSETALSRAHARGVPALPSYGLTEACSQVCTRAPGADEAGVGQPLPGIEVRVQGGLIEVRGPTLFSGYWGGEPHDPSAWLDTGDLGSWDERGSLHVTGRRSELIITGGENVHPVEVEKALAPLFGSRHFCVFGSSDPIWGERVTLAVEGVSDPHLVAQLVSLASERLANFKRPRAVAFVEKLPELATGKIARRLLPNLCAFRLASIDYEKGDSARV